ncbi:hypothetical protein [Lysinibacillus sp. UBA5990]|uniref:hypothetical protein n=1 Tax=Lysinibacillus sp. UBA5990 TaxID=1946773 RepID=UPI000E9C513A|nr:hypothetical protein [Lysinibacillus sp. UBA5990]HBJ00934.1 hypothetical protein [Lysinibacillus sp.]
MEHCYKFYIKNNSKCSRAPVWKAFDRTKSSSEFFDSGAVTADFGVMFTEKKNLSKYVFVGYTTVGVNGNLPSSWVLQGSHNTTDGVNGDWDLLDILSGHSWSGTLEKKPFTVNKVAEYKVFRFKDTKNKTSGTYIYVAELELLSLVIPATNPYWSTVLIDQLKEHDSIPMNKEEIK